MKEGRQNKKKEPGAGRPLALVTGGATGIGRACCLALARQGFRVAIHFHRSAASANAVLQALEGDGFLLQGDLTDITRIDEMLDQIRHSADRIDVLVNNAGISVNGLMVRMKIADFDRQRAILRGGWFLTRQVLRRFMLRQEEGRIINISSVVGHTGNSGQMPYTMEKAGLDAMTKSLVKELWGRNILVNSIAPGFIQTGMTENLPEEIRQGIVRQIPLCRMGTPDEVADVVAFLARRGGYINGSVIHVNGGMYGG